MAEHTNVKGEGKTVEELFANNVVYFMPSFQRGYVWEIKNLKLYWKDLEHLTKEKKSDDTPIETSFLGALVLQEKRGKHKNILAPSRGVPTKRYMVIDGQQRLTTLYLTLLALFVYAAEQAQRLQQLCEQADKEKVDKLGGVNLDGWQGYANDPHYRGYLFSHAASNSKEIKLQPSPNDYPQFYAIVDKLEKGLKLKALKKDRFPDMKNIEREEVGKLYDAYVFLQDKIKSFITKDGVGEAKQIERYGKIFLALVEGTEVVQITAKPHLFPNEIFDRLNTSGVRLGTLDWVRNDIFGRLPVDKDTGLPDDEGFDAIWGSFERELKDVSKIIDTRPLTSKSEEARKKEEQKRKEKREVNQSEIFFKAYGVINQGSKFNVGEQFRCLKEDWDKKIDTKDYPQQYHYRYGDAEVIVKSLEEHLPSYLALCAGKKLVGINPELWSLIENMKELLLPESTYPFLMPVIRSSMEEEGLSVEHAMQAFKIVESLVVRLTLSGKSMAYLTAVFQSLWTDCKKENMNHELIWQKIKTKKTDLALLESDEEIKRNIINASVYGKRREKYILMQYEKELGKNSHSLPIPLHECHIDHIMPQAKSKVNGATGGGEERARLCGTLGNLTLLDPKINSLKSAKNFEAVRHLLEGSDLRSVKELLKDFDRWDTDAIKQRGDKLAHWAVKRWPLTPEKF